VKEDLTDQELLEIAERKREDIEAYRRDSKPHGVGHTIGDTLTRIRERGKRAGKGKGSNRWEPPDKDYTKIPHEFIDARYSHSFTRNESKVFGFILRKTWCWQKKSEVIPLKQFEKELDISKPHISRALSSLTKRRIVTKIGNKRYAIQANTTLWRHKPTKSGTKKRKK